MKITNIQHPKIHLDGNNTNPNSEKGDDFFTHLNEYQGLSKNQQKSKDYPNIIIFDEEGNIICDIEDQEDIISGESKILMFPIEETDEIEEIEKTNEVSENKKNHNIDNSNNQIYSIPVLQTKLMSNQSEDMSEYQNKNFIAKIDINASVIEKNINSNELSNISFSEQSVAIGENESNKSVIVPNGKSLDVVQLKEGNESNKSVIVPNGKSLDVVQLKEGNESNKSVIVPNSKFLEGLTVNEKGNEVFVITFVPSVHKSKNILPPKAELKEGINLINNGFNIENTGQVEDFGNQNQDTKQFLEIQKLTIEKNENENISISMFPSVVKELIVAHENNDIVTSAVDQVKISVEVAIQKSKDKIQVKLSPPELGKIEITLEYNKDKVSVIRVLVENKDTLNTLKEGTSILKESLIAIPGAEDAQLSFDVAYDHNQNNQSTNYQEELDFLKANQADHLQIKKLDSINSQNKQGYDKNLNQYNILV